MSEPIDEAPTKSAWQKETDMLVAAQVSAYQSALTSLRAMAATDLKRAFSLGQTHWQLTDSNSYAENKKSAATRAKFDELLRKYNADMER